MVTLRAPAAWRRFEGRLLLTFNSAAGVPDKCGLHQLNGFMSRAVKI